jgi:hypothetical protein
MEAAAAAAANELSLVKVVTGIESNHLFKLPSLHL